VSALVRHPGGRRAPRPPVAPGEAHSPRPPRRLCRKGARGAALLVVTVSLAVLTAFAVDLAYETRVTLQIAVNGRDELRATAAAKGAANLARLVLYFQNKLDAQGQAASQLNPQIAALLPRIQVWSLVPVGPMLTDALFGGGASPAAVPGPAPAPGTAAAPAEGAFDARIEDEGTKVNAQLDGSSSGGLLGGQLAAYFDLVGNPKWDFLFDREDETGMKATRNDVAINLVDWVDEDNVTSGLTGNPASPVEKAFGDENYWYDRGPDRYHAKNARFDSLDELYLVAGVTDAFMGAFGDQLTVYLRRDVRFSISCNDPENLVRDVRIMADPPVQPAVADPMMPERIVKAVKDLTFGCLRMLSVQELATIAQQVGGIKVNSVYTTSSGDSRGAFGPPPGVYRIRAHGTAGQVTKTIDAVVTMDPKLLQNQIADLGRLLHWREE